MKKFIILILLVFTIQGVWAQKYDATKVSKKAVAFYEKAMTDADEGRYEEALIQLSSALTAYPMYVDAMLSQAGILGELKRYAESVQAYERAFASDPEYAREYYLPYAINLTGKGDFEKGLEAIEVFLRQPGLNEASIKSGEYRKRNIQFALNYKKSSTYDESIKIIGIGDGVNSGTSEYFPSLTIDGKKLIFTKRVANNEDFYASEKQGNQWMPASPLTGAINTPMNEGGQQVSQDGKWLVYAGCNFPDS